MIINFITFKEGEDVILNTFGNVLRLYLGKARRAPFAKRLESGLLTDLFD